MFVYKPSQYTLEPRWWVHLVRFSRHARNNNIEVIIGLLMAGSHPYGGRFFKMGGIGRFAIHVYSLNAYQIKAMLGADYITRPILIIRTHQVAIRYKSKISMYISIHRTWLFFTIWLVTFTGVRWRPFHTFNRRRAYREGLRTWSPWHRTTSEDMGGQHGHSQQPRYACASPTKCRDTMVVPVHISVSFAGRRHISHSFN